MPNFLFNRLTAVADLRSVVPDKITPKERVCLFLLTTFYGRSYRLHEENVRLERALAFNRHERRFYERKADQLLRLHIDPNLSMPCDTSVGLYAPDDEPIEVCEDGTLALSDEDFLVLSGGGDK